MKYAIKENSPVWLNKVPWYNTSIFSKCNGTVFEDFIWNFRTDKYDLMCYITTPDKQQSTCVDYAISDVGREIHKNETKTELKPIGATLEFIDCWIKHFQHNRQ